MVQLTDLVKGDRIIFTDDFKAMLGPEISKGTKGKIRYVRQKYFPLEYGKMSEAYCWIDLDGENPVYINQEQNPSIEKI